MNRVDPADLFRALDRLNVEIDDDRLVVAADHDAIERFVAGGIDLLVRHIRRHKDEIAGTGLGDVFEMLAPAHSCLALEHVDHAFEMPVMVRPGLGIGVDLDRSGPDLLRPYAGEIYRRGT